MITPCIESKKNQNLFDKSYFILATFPTCFFSPFSSFNNEKIKLQVLHNKQITTHDNGNVQSHAQEESKLTSTTNTNTSLNTKNVHLIRIT